MSDLVVGLLAGWGLGAVSVGVLVIWFLTNPETWWPRR
jgi:hypothetical protein